ncbi:transketolase [Segnochrobactrum spirostomi]|uniref:Transketolase n=1 Tax=Segnochrobactrum spirostomi TaxID=2608987 RepID=A0A6A7Y6V1_9HYPH|nr:transketolase [Segnochrobactrum spirostomi]MQT13392.1 transketolase [Segnochrobactrum spirostomi]
MIDLKMQTQMANAIRVLSIDAVEKAKSGHPGLPMGTADIATTLFTQVLRFDPSAPHWPNRDRFVLSAGHGSMLLYSLLFLLGYEDMTLEAIENFRQLGSAAAGHPEYGHAAGIETTTGPLGQGIATAVGMALAERLMNAQFGSDLIDHRTFVLCGDGDLMEGISHEAISIAGHLNLSRMIVLYDDNHISIDGPTSLADSTDTLKRFEAAGWAATRIDGYDIAEILKTIEWAETTGKPTLIACRTVIGFGSPKKAGTAAAHGAPLGAEEVAAARASYGWTAGPFEVPAEILEAWRAAGQRSVDARKEWERRYRALPADERAEFDRRIRGDLPAGFDEAIRAYKARLSADKPNVASRKSSEMALEVVNAVVPEMIGGSADLTHSNLTRTKSQKGVVPGDYSGTFVNWGIREHGMAAAMNGIALHGGLIPYSGGFLIFSDYCRPSIRLAALMGIRVIHVFTHDSIGLGEDGPTHQPVEHLASLRAIPNTLVLRPADAVEVAEAWQLALEHRTGPSLLALSRQNLPTLRTEHVDENLSARGAYEIRPASGEAKVSIFATGSEVAIAVAAKALLDEAGWPTRIVSVPSFELFEKQSDEYKASVLGTAPVKVAVEAAIRMGWDRFIGDGPFIGMSSFGASAPIEVLYKHFGITAEAVADAAKARAAKLGL